MRLHAAYLFERPFLPISLTHFHHAGIDTLTLQAVQPQSKIDLASILPLWHCTANGDDSHWRSLLRFLDATASCVLCSCVHPSTRHARIDSRNRHEGAVCAVPCQREPASRAAVQNGDARAAAARSGQVRGRCREWREDGRSRTLASGRLKIRPVFASKGSER